MDAAAAIDLLGVGPIREVRVDFTELCNLRCVYCSVSSKSYQGIHMPVPLTRTAVDMILALRRFHPDVEIDVNGNGETTYREDWIDLVRPLHEAGLPVRIQSNFAKEFSADELDVLAGMKAITISIDTADRKQLRRFRRSVDVRQITNNILMVRAAASRLQKRAPAFYFACGLYDKNALLVEELARLAVVLGVKLVDFWNLHDHHHDDNGVSAEDRVYPLDNLTDDELRPRVEAIRRAVAYLQARGVTVGMQGEFVNILAKRVGLDG